MVQFNLLKINPDNSISLDIQVKDMSYYTNVYLDKIILEQKSDYIESGISNNPVFTYTLATQNSKREQITFDSSDFNIPVDVADNLFIVYVKVKGTPSSDTPCGMDNITTTSVLYKREPFLQKGLSFIREIDYSCDIPKNFIDFILQEEAMKLATTTGNYTKVIELFNKFKSNTSSSTLTNKCSCNG